jgi:5-methylcytosine-specific restriction endonuclease McrA
MKKKLSSVSGWREARRRVLAASRVCHLCGELIDFEAPPRSARAPAVDHLDPVSRLDASDPAAFRRLALNPSNLRAAHVGCNNSRKAKDLPPRRTSRRWT